MTTITESIQLIDLNKVDVTGFAQHVGCVVLTKDNKIMLQQRSHDWRTFPDCLVFFGGHMEVNETPMESLVRELKEELGARVDPSQVVSLGTILETIAEDRNLIHIYFWHDKQGTITGCYECEAKSYSDCAEAFMHPKIMDCLSWALMECQKRQLLR